MISLTPSPFSIQPSQSLRLILDIQGQMNIKMYKGTYFNICLKKNGGTLGTVVLYPLRFNGCPLEWEVTPYSYEQIGTTGTFSASCFVQNGPNPNTNSIVGTTFIVGTDLYDQDQSVCDDCCGETQTVNLTMLSNCKKVKNLWSNVKKDLVPIDYSGGCSVEKVGDNQKMNLASEALVYGLNRKGHNIDQSIGGDCRQITQIPVLPSGKIQSVRKNV